MKPIISIITPSIRNDNIPKYIESIQNTIDFDLVELIFIGPKPHDLYFEYNNIKYIKDLGHPNRCQQLGLNIAEGNYIHFSADDAIYHEDSVDTISLFSVKDLLEKHRYDAITLNYGEGGNTAVGSFSIAACYPSGRFVRQEWLIFNNGFLRRELAQKYNLDCQFEVTCLGHADLAVRLQRSNVEIVLVNKLLMSCGHMPDITGDHAPVHYAQTESDQQRFIAKYSHPGTDIYIDHNNYDYRSEPVWSRRFS